MNRVKDKVAIVTGGAQGIGRSACLLLAREGAIAIAADIAEEDGKKLAEEIRSTGGRAEFRHLNVTDEDEVRDVFAAVDAQFGRLDVLVNNAGIAGVNKPTDTITEKEWDKVFGINVKGVFFSTKHAIPLMRKGRAGSIINVSSIFGIVGSPDLPPYHASKAAVRLMSKTDALLYAKDNIRVNSIHPGFIWTAFMEELGQRLPEGAEAFRKQLDNLHPIGHVGEPDDVAFGILYLASDESRFVTGSELVIDGGYTCR
jgi:NAD(P)-dependent dehydrogenase (short-subunit alcohol dehydrogenase family)